MTGKEVAESKTAGTIVVNSELLGDKLAALICELIDIEPEHDVRSVVIRTDGYPAEGDDEVFSMAYADTQSIAVNLKKCWDSACDKAASGEVSMSLLHIYWTNVLVAVGHEIDHIDVARQDRDGYEALRSTSEGYRQLEEAADIRAKNFLLQLALQFNIEMPAPADLGWAGVKWMELNTGDEMEEEWVQTARLMLETGVIYDDGEHEILTYREFIKMKFDAEGKHSWEQATTCVNMTAKVGDEEVVIEAEPVAEPEVAPAKEVIIEQAQPQSQMSLFVGAVDDGEYDDSPDEMPEDASEAVLSGDNADTVVVGYDEDGSAIHDAAEVMVAGPALAPALALPPQVAAVQQQYAAHAAAAAAPKQTPTTYTPNTLDGPTMKAVIEQVWRTLHHHLFMKCGWMQNPQTGRFFFSSPANVLEPVNIEHILKHYGADNFIMEYDTVGATGSYAAEKVVNGTVRGHISTGKAHLPCYDVYLNVGGRRVHRTLMPGNPEKKDQQNAYTNSANESAAGNAISFVFKDKSEVAPNAKFQEKITAKLTNNDYVSY